MTTNMDAQELSDPKFDRSTVRAIQPIIYWDGQIRPASDWSMDIEDDVPEDSLLTVEESNLRGWAPYTHVLRIESAEGWWLHVLAVVERTDPEPAEDPIIDSPIPNPDLMVRLEYILRERDSFRMLQKLNSEKAQEEHRLLGEGGEYSPYLDGYYRGRSGAYECAADMLSSLASELSR